MTSIVQFFFTVTVSPRQSSAMLVLPCDLYSSCPGREIQNWSTSKQHPKFRSSDLQWRILVLVITGRQSATCVVLYIPYGLWPHSTLPLIFRPWQRQDKGKQYCLWFLPLKKTHDKNNFGYVYHQSWNIYRIFQVFYADAFHICYNTAYFGVKYLAF